MLSLQSTSALFLNILATAMTLQLATAQTPPQFSPAISNHLNVTYSTTPVNPAGITVSGNSVTNAPILGLCSDSSTPYLTILMDFTVAGVLPNGNTTLIHWIQGNLTHSTCTRNLTSVSRPIAPYAPPGPPAGLTHTYGVFLYAQPTNFTIPADYIPFFNNLTASINNRIGFNLTKFAEETALGKPVAADWFLVSTPNATTSSTGSSSSPTKKTTSEGTSVEIGMLGFVAGLFCAMINSL